ncbi:MAG: LPS export ABC transporter periplasmic protein LptC [Deltaproteobacteria bacterium]|nr:LPS export ABC transporter periplasmic protein LptC [Deltaproteobacteria bacterium]
MTVHKKINRLRLLFLLIIGGFIIAISTVIYINVKLKNITKAPKSIIKLSKNVPDLRLENVHYEKTRKGKIEWEIEAKVAHHYQGKDLLTLDGVKMLYYGGEKRTVIIKGKQGRIKPSTKDVELLGEVFIKSSDGYELRTNSLKYSSKTSTITTGDRVTILGKKFSISGVGMELDIKKDRLSILHAVQTTIKGNFVKGNIPRLGF